MLDEDEDGMGMANKQLPQHPCEVSETEAACEPPCLEAQAACPRL